MKLGKAIDDICHKEMQNCFFFEKIHTKNDKLRVHVH
jgi:hypothetical protein